MGHGTSPPNPPRVRPSCTPMSLARLQDEWLCYGSGRRWRCCADTRYVCEVDDAETAPDYSHLPHVMSKLRRIKAVYYGRVALGRLDQFGTGIDVLVANALTESLGSVPSPISTTELRQVYASAVGNAGGVKLDAVVRHIAMAGKYLERREPGYVDPVATPGRRPPRPHQHRARPARRTAVITRAARRRHRRSGVAAAGRIALCRRTRRALFQQ